MASNGAPRQAPNGNGNGNGISGKTKIQLQLAIPFAVFVVSATAWVVRAENIHQDRLDRIHRLEKQLNDHHNSIDDRFRGADMDRWLERCQWAWQSYAEAEGLTCYPSVPPWLEGSSYFPSTIETNK